MPTAVSKFLDHYRECALCCFEHVCSVLFELDVHYIRYFFPDDGCK
jgi:hypothetical protein